MIRKRWRNHSYTTIVWCFLTAITKHVRIIHSVNCQADHVCFGHCGPKLYQNFVCCHFVMLVLLHHGTSSSTWLWSLNKMNIIYKYSNQHKSLRWMIAIWCSTRVIQNIQKVFWFDQYGQTNHLVEEVKIIFECIVSYTLTSKESKIWKKLPPQKLQPTYSSALVTLTLGRAPYP